MASSPLPSPIQKLIPPMKLTLALSLTLAAALLMGAALFAAPSPTPMTPKTPAAARPADPKQSLERTSFQEAAPWTPGVQLRSDVAMAYGINASLPERIAKWKAEGYIVHLMTGVSWGEYQDYLYGRFDGQNHVDEAQMDRNGNVISHGGDVYYMSPGVNFGKFLSQGVRRAIDAGAEAIHLEEPEFWVRGGYGAGFQREWKAYYHEDWVPPHTSPDAQWRSSKLKYYLYQRALKQVFDYVKAYNLEHHRNIKCYVPTHSLPNYAHWRIVSPESSLMTVGADGYIAQVWTGTARTANVYQGLLKQRTFETAFLEYGAMMNIVRASKGTVWFLNDPIEDNPNHTWSDYQTNWESTLTASLLWPQVWRYEVMPWPNRIFHGKYPNDAGERLPIPPDYATELMTVINALNDMKQSKVEWTSGTQGVGVVVSDTMMFQRGDPQSSDEHLGSFYGLALPLVKRGIPVEPVQLENATLAGALKPYRVLLMTYEGMKPMTPEVHAALAAWVKAGGALVFVGDDSDPYTTVRDWWNTAPHAFASPRIALLDALGLPADTPAGLRKVGRGVLLTSADSPAALTYRADGADTLRHYVRQACEAVKLPYRETNAFILRRGPYVVATGLDESLPGEPPTLKGRFLDLFDPNLSILDQVTAAPGSRRFLLDLDRVKRKVPTVLAGACKILGERRTARGLRFYAEAPDDTEAAVRIRLAAEPARVTMDDAPLPDSARVWDEASGTLLLRFPNSAQGHWINVEAAH